MVPVPHRAARGVRLRYAPRFMVSIRRTALGAVVLALALSAAACSHAPAKRVGAMPIDARPTPEQPPPDSTVTIVTNGGVEPTPASPPRAPKPSTTRLDHVLADTTAARAAIDRCGRRLLPDQEPIVTGTVDLLVRAHAALVAGHLESAESLARKARQLSSSLGCR